MARTDISDYAAVQDLSIEFVRDWIRLADKVDGTAGLTREGALVITLQPGVSAQEVSAGITNDDFPHCYVIPGTDSVLIPDLG